LFQFYFSYNHSIKHSAVLQSSAINVEGIHGTFVYTVFHTYKTYWLI